MRETHTMENTQTEVQDWVKEELATLGTPNTNTERLPSFKLQSGKVVSFTVDDSQPFGEYKDEAKQVIKKIIPVTGKQDGVEGRYNLWLNVRNPLYKELLDGLARGQKKFYVSTTGTQDQTRYEVVELD